jgi:hypothetical protein
MDAQGTKRKKDTATLAPCQPQDQALGKRLKPTQATATKTPIFGLNWYNKQEPALKEFNGASDAMLIKHGSYQFASHPSRTDFISLWCDRDSNEPLPIYELIVDGPARLHVDVEGIYPGPEPSANELRNWIGLVITAIQEALEESGIEQ